MSNWKQRVTAYYEKTLWDYVLVFFRGNYSMNFGYWDDTVQSRNDAFTRLYTKIADNLALKPDDRVLDAGCGMGEAACFMAKMYGCHATGVTINPGHIRQATNIIARRKLGDLVNIKLMDYTKTTFPDGSFDAVYAIETICHLPDKTDFYQEAYRLLAPGGRLVVVEYIQKKEPQSPRNRKEMEMFLDYAAMPNIWTVGAHRSAIKRCGYTNIVIEDFSTATVPISRYLYRYSLFGIPLYRVLRWGGFINEERMKNALWCRYQWLTKQKGLWGHAMISATKPKK